MPITRARAAGELAALVLTGALFLLFENVLGLKTAFLAAALPAWAVYAAVRLRRTPGLAEVWGLGRQGFGGAAGEAAGVLAAGVGGLLTYRLFLGWRPFPPGAPLVFLAYPAWALAQQFALQALAGGNLDRLGLPRPGAVAATALLFGLAHAPDWPLAGLCAAAGGIWASIFLRWRNLWALAVSHAWLGALAYYWILERDPLKEMRPPAP